MFFHPGETFGAMFTKDARGVNEKWREESQLIEDKVELDMFGKPVVICGVQASGHK